jgi:hypothetical protein
MRSPWRPLWIAGALVVSIYLISSPGCSCPRAEQEQAKQEAPPEPQQSATPPITEQEPSEEAAERASESSASTDLTPSPQKEESTPESKSADKGADAQAGSAAHSDPTAASGSTTKSGQPASPKLPQPTGSPLKARQTAERLGQSARKAAAKGDFSKAFRDARAAWEEVCGFTGDAQCQAAARKLAREMAVYAARANEAAGEPATGKTLVVE